MYSHKGGDHIKDPAFSRQIESPACIHETKTNTDYRVYTFNEQQPGDPVVVKLGLGSTALNRSGQRYLKAFSDEIPRPLVLLEPDRQIPNIERSAEADLNVIDRLGIERMEVMGMSRGALLAAGLAIAMQERANHLLTISGVTRDGLRSYASGAVGVFMEGRREREEPGLIPDCVRDVLHPEDTFFMDQLRKVSRFGAGILLVLHPSFQYIPEKLAASTRWTDIVGAHDNFTDTLVHQEVIARRNSIEPDTASLAIVDNMGHLWTRHREWLGKTAARVFMGQDKVAGHLVVDELPQQAGAVAFPVRGPFPGLAQPA